MVSGAETYFDSAPMLLAFLLAGRFLDSAHAPRDAAGRRRPRRPQAASAPSGSTRTARRARWRSPRSDRATSCWRARAREFPVDGVVEDGRSEIDQSFVTGETRPVAVEAGSQVFAGAINLGGALRIRVRQAATGTLVDEVNALLEKAIEQRSSYVQLADRAARYYAPLVALDRACRLSRLARRSARPGGRRWKSRSPCSSLPVPARWARRSRRSGGGGGRVVPARRDPQFRRCAGAARRYRHGRVRQDRHADLAAPELVNAGDASADELALAGALALSSRHPLAAAVAAAAGANTPIDGARISRPGRHRRSSRASG